VDSFSDLVKTVSSIALVSENYNVLSEPMKYFSRTLLWSNV